MQKIAIITLEQKNQLVGQEFTKLSYFNPVNDCQGNWVISEEEINQCTNLNFIWVKGLELTDFCAPLLDISEV